MRPIPFFRLVWVCGVLSALSVSAAEAARPIELADYYRLESAGAPAISPDGSRVAFVRSYILEADNRRHSEIWLARSDGSPPMRLTSPAFSSEPALQPRGRAARLQLPSQRARVGETRPRSGSCAWIDPGARPSRSRGSRARRVFSRDGRWIAFTKETPPGPKPKPEPLPDFDRKIQERFKGRIFDWMQYRADGRGYQPDPRDPIASPARELYVVARDGWKAPAPHHARLRRARAGLEPRRPIAGHRGQRPPARRAHLRAIGPLGRAGRGRRRPALDRRRLRPRGARLVTGWALARLHPAAGAEHGDRPEADPRRPDRSVHHARPGRAFPQPHRRLGPAAGRPELEPGWPFHLLQRRDRRAGPSVPGGGRRRQGGAGHPGRAPGERH